jgi:hypothetical protein
MVRVTPASPRAIVEDADARARELLLEFRLAAVDDRRDRLERQDALDVRIEQRADVRQRLHLGRISVVAADRDNARPGADLVEHLGHAGTSEMIRAIWLIW